MSEKIFAPNIHLFAFHLRHGFTPNSQPFNVPPEWLEKKYSQILKNFDIHQPVNLRADIPKAYRVNLLQGAENNGKSILKLGKGKTPQDSNNGSIPQIEVEAVAYPVQIEDSYILTLNIRRPQQLDGDAVEIERLKDFNPQECFLSNSINSYLGQTILITAFLDEQQKQKDRQFLQKLADQCVSAFIHTPDKSKSPLCYQSGKLFGSPIFEYGIPSQPTTYGHIIVWFFWEEETSKKFINRYGEFIDLFLYRNKIITAYQNSREDSNVADLQIGQIENNLGEFKQKYALNSAVIDDASTGLAKISVGQDKSLAQPAVSLNSAQTPDIEILAEADLKELNARLKVLLNIALDYSQGQRNLEYYRNTIKINTRNYQQKLHQIQELSQEDISFLKTFAENESKVFQEQIEADLSYFVHGSGLLDKAIATIRGLVEIDQAERDRSLERTIQVVGVALGAGQIVGSATGYIDKPFAPQISPSLPLHPFVSSLIWSLVAVLVAGGLTWCWTRPKQRRLKNPANKSANIPRD
ncbi:MAG: hypothetical protein KME08_04300 [Aphanothece sp. CMT-3BRIN-NPC111]|jgi:hypothetical protein|nr:hypothetical protein [Aphanothece sp. CMT-3BRIN-NPC111]